MNKIIRVLAAAGCAALSGQIHAATNIIDDTHGYDDSVQPPLGAGSFELGDYPTTPRPGSLALANGSTTIAGWTVGGGGVEWLDSSAYALSEGMHAVSLSGSGSISTEIPTIAGMQYTLSFSSYVTDAAAGLVTAGDLSQIFAPSTSTDPLNPDWVDYVFTFTALGPSTTINFAATTPGASGPVIDNVVVYQIPEPSALVLGSVFVLFGGTRRKR